MRLTRSGTSPVDQEAKQDVHALTRYFVSPLSFVDPFQIYTAVKQNQSPSISIWLLLTCLRKRYRSSGLATVTFG